MQVSRRPVPLKYGGNLMYYSRFVAGWVRECMLTWTIVGSTFISMTRLSVGVSCWFTTKGYGRTLFFFWNMTPRHGVSSSWRSQRTCWFHLSGLALRCSRLVRSCGIWCHGMLYQRFRRYSFRIRMSKHLWTPEDEGSTFLRNAGNSIHNDAASERTLRRFFLLLFLWSLMDGWKMSTWSWLFYIVFGSDDRNHSKPIRPFTRLCLYRKRIWN